MNCRQARIDLALCVGEDLPEAARRESLRRHVAQCPGCRAHYKRLRGALRVLESADDRQTYDVGGSLWPQVSNRIRRLEEVPQPTSRFNGWLPFVAVTAACAMLVVAMDTRPSRPAPGIARNVFGIPSIFEVERPHDGGQSPAFLPARYQQYWTDAALDADSAAPFHSERTTLERRPDQPVSPTND